MAVEPVELHRICAGIGVHQFLTVDKFALIADLHFPHWGFS